MPEPGSARPQRRASKAARLWLLALPAGVGILLVALRLSSGSGSPDPDVAAVEETVRAYEKAIRDSDVEEFQALTTSGYFDRYLTFAGPASLNSPNDPELALGQRLQHQIEAVTIAADSATVLASLRGVGAQDLDAVELHLVRRDGAWLVDATGMRRTIPPSGAQLIELAMGDFSFKPDPLVIRRGRPLVIRARNQGAQSHMVAIWLVPPEYELIKLIEATDEMPGGVERIVNSRIFAVGDEGDLTIKNGFKRGRYMLTCFLSDVTSPSLTPHYDLGMLTEFEVK